MMKRLLYRLAVGLAAFALGLGLNAIWKAQRPLSLCELDANPMPYAGKTIRFRALIERHRNTIIGGSFCSDANSASISIELDPAEAASFSLPEMTMTGDRKLDNTYLMDAVIVGHLDSHFGMGCFGPKYHLTNAGVERIFAVRQFQGDSREVIKWYKSNSY